jgi:hypothetical protein
MGKQGEQKFYSPEPIAEVPKVVTPTKVGVQNLLIILDSRVRENDKTYEYASFAIGSPVIINTRN